MKEEYFYGKGKRKTSTARTRLYSGSGQILVNGRPYQEYFPRATLQMIINQPLKLTQATGKFDIKINVDGGGAGRTGRGSAPRNQQGSSAGGSGKPACAQEGRPADQGCQDQGEKEVRPERRQGQIPVLQALTGAPEAKTSLYQGRVHALPFFIA